MKILDRLPYFDRPTFLSFGAHTVEVRSYQILVWLSIAQPVFPAVLDTGHSHNVSVTARQLREWAGVEALEEIGQIEVNRRLMSQHEASVRIHRNRPGTREPLPESCSLVIDQGITVIPEDGAIRLPLLGLRAITRSGLKLLIDGKRRELTLRTG